MTTEGYRQLDNLCCGAEALFELFRKITQRWIEVAGAYSNTELYAHAIDAIADALTEEGYTLISNKHYCELTGDTND